MKTKFISNERSQKHVPTLNPVYRIMADRTRRFTLYHMLIRN